MTPVSKTDYVAAQGATRCVDERGDKHGELLGVQLPGGSEHLMDLFLLALEEVGAEYDEALLFDMTQHVYTSSLTDEYNLEPGVHIDDEHGKLSLEASADRVVGCGYDKVRGDVLQRLGVELSYSPGERISQAREHQWSVQILTGDHFANATAAINRVPGQTLQTKALLVEDRIPSFNYDLWVVTAAKPAMIAALNQAGYSKAAKTLEAQAEDWGRQLYIETLDILTDGRLGQDLLVFES